MYATRQKNVCRLELQLQKPVLCVALVYTLCLVVIACTQLAKKLFVGSSCTVTKTRSLRGYCVYTLCLVASAESLKLQPDFASYDHEQKTPSSSIVPVTDETTRTRLYSIHPTTHHYHGPVFFEAYYTSTGAF